MLEAAKISEPSAGVPSAPTPSVTGVIKSIEPVLAKRTALAPANCVSSDGPMDNASACTPAGTNAMLEEPSDHSAPVP